MRFHGVVGSDPEFSTSLKVFFAGRLRPGAHTDIPVLCFAELGLRRQALLAISPPEALALKNRQEYRGCIVRMNRGPDMKCASILPLAIVLATTSAIGQDTRANSDKTYLVTDRINCPIGLQVKHGPGLPLAMNAGPSISKKPPSDGQVRAQDQNQGLHLTLINLSPQSIMSAQLIVHGFSNKSRYISLSKATPDLAKTVDVALDVKGNGQATRNLSLSHFTAITAVEVNAITYADGATWRTSSPGACSVSPDLLMLVNADR